MSQYPRMQTEPLPPRLRDPGDYSARAPTSLGWRTDRLRGIDRVCKARRMASSPPSRPAPRGGRSLRVAMDATPLIGNRTGVGAFCLGAIGGLAEREDISISAFAVSWRRRGL